MKKIKLFFLFSIFVSGLFAQKIKTDSVYIAKLAAKEQIQKYSIRVVKGEKMEDIARLYSQDPGSSIKGGLYINVRKGVMDPEFEKVSFSLKQGQISEVFETAYGYHFVQLIKRNGDLLDLRHVLIIPKEKK